MWQHLFLFVCAVAVTMGAIGFLRPHALGLGLLDVPDQRKHHGEPVPMIGGIAVAFSVFFISLLFSTEHRALAAFVIAALPMLMMGLLDDRLGLTARQKFAIQVVVALTLIYGAAVSIGQLGDLFGFGLVTLGWLAMPFTVVCIVGIVNAYNMADGVDGLAGSMSLASAVAFGVVAALCDAPVEFAIAVALAGALCGFLAFNLPHRRRPFRVFLGDAGSTFIGLALVLLAIGLTQRQGTALSPIAAVWILGLAILDMGATMLTRMAMGHSPIAPDRRHLHHLLLDLGMRPSRVVLGQSLVAALMATVGVIAWRDGLPEHWLTYGYFAVAAVYWLAVSHGWRVVGRLGGSP